MTTRHHPLPTMATALLTLAALSGWSCGRVPGPTEEAAEHGHVHEGPDAESHDHGEGGDGESWAVTAWGEIYGLFPEVDALVAGQVAVSHTHVTILDGFQPLTSGTVEIVLRDGAGETAFAGTFLRNGIFNVAIEPAREGDFDLSFRIASGAGDEEIRGGRVRVGSAASPGGLLSSETPPAPSAGGEPLSFLLEQQWQTPFATAWVDSGLLARDVAGLARVRPPAGGAAVLSAPVDAVLRSAPWPYPGQAVAAGTTVFRLMPRVAADRSLPALTAERDELATQLGVAEARLERLEHLYSLEATSAKELAESRALVTTLTTRLQAAESDLDAATAARGGGSSGVIDLGAPFAGKIAAVQAEPGAVVAAGAPLARVVRTDEIWLEVALTPQAARHVAGGVRGVVIAFPEGPTLRLDQGVRLVSVAPEVDAGSGSVTALLSLPPVADLILGARVSVEILLEGGEEGVVIPTTALIDDGGVPVVYLQTTGEEFARQPIRIVHRQGDRVLAEGLIPGQRLVTVGGDAIRRSSLMATGEAHGHVH